MRTLFFKMLPHIVGGLIGLLIIFPPDAFQALGLWRFLVLAAIAIIGLLAMSGFLIAVNFLREVAVEPVEEALAPDVAALIDRFRSTGFELVIPLLRLDLRPPGTMSIMINRSAECWASVYSTGTIPRRVGYEIYSEIEGERGTLTSLADPGAAVLPLMPGYFKQVFFGALPEVLLARHGEAQAFLMARGVRFEPPGPQDIPARIRRAAKAQRQFIAANPLKALVLLVWRGVTRTTPYNQPVAIQKTTEATLRYLLQEQPAPALGAEPEVPVES
jgi:hypothetical protein